MTEFDFDVWPGAANGIKKALEILDATKLEMDRDDEYSKAEFFNYNAMLEMADIFVSDGGTTGQHIIWDGKAHRVV